MNVFNQKISYITASFFTGFSLMVVELVSARIVAPIVGNSVFTWTSVIGITLLGLSIGSFTGGKLADIKRDAYTHMLLPVTFFISAVLVFIIPLLTKTTGFLLEFSDSIVFLNVVISSYLFLLPAIALGAVQPMLLKKYALDFSHIGKEYGTLSSAWSIGSIFGVFLTGFVFISFIGSKETLWLITALLLASSLFFSFYNKKLFLSISSFILFCLLGGVLLHTFTTRAPEHVIGKADIIFDTETDYYHARVADVDLFDFGKSRVLALDFDFHSIETLTVNEHFYPEIYPAFSEIKNDIQSILTIGAGAYTMPKYFSTFYPNASISVMEMDPALIRIGTTYFGLDSSKIRTQIGDARVLLPKSDQKYDLIFGDAYNSFISVPWSLLTREWNEEVKLKISSGGIYAVNFIGAMDGPQSAFTKSVVKTFRLTFPNYYTFSFGADSQGVQNIVLVGINGPLPLSLSQLSQKLSSSKNPFLAKRLFSQSSIDFQHGILLTDNFAPVERLMKPLIEDYFPKNLALMKQVF